MKILSLDSTAKVASVALCEDGRLLAEYTVQNGNKHSETLLPMCESILNAFGMKPHDIDMFALSAGPGSFTGVRIGAATVKGLAFGTDIPCIGVSTLHALAYNLLSDEDAFICPVMDARRGQLYTATFRSEGGRLLRLTPDRAISYTEFEQDVIALGERVYLTGDGYDLVCRSLDEKYRRVTPALLRAQSAYSVAQAALECYADGARTTEGDVRPIYLRLSQAERERLEAEARTEGK